MNNMKPIEIKTINTIVGRKLLCGRVIIESGDYTDSHRDVGEYYKFVINSQASGVRADGEHTIVLSRKSGNRYSPNDSETIGKYEMFTMGLQARTSVYLKPKDIQSMDTIVDYIDKAMHETYEFYKNKNY